MKLQSLVDEFTCVKIANQEDNADILNFIEHISMQTSDGGLGIDRLPNFFSLTRAQGEKSFTFLFLNANKTLGGIGCISLTSMQVKGKTEKLGYCSDLKFSRKIDRQTRIEFYQFYEKLIENFAKIEELDGCQYVLSSILDENVAAKKSIVQKESRKSKVQSLPVYQYENINVLAKLPFWISNATDEICTGDRVGKEKIIAFLTSNPEGSEVVWTVEEIARRQKVVGFSFDDFLVRLNDLGEIEACTLLLSDYSFRKMRVTSMPWALRMSQILTPILGQPKIRENEPLKVGYLSFLKINKKAAKDRAQVIHSFLQKIFFQQRALARGDRFHLYNVQESIQHKIKTHLSAKGYLCNAFSSTVYQMTTEPEPPLHLKCQANRLDFDVVFH